MWTILEYFYRNSDAHQVNSTFWPINSIVPPDIFLRGCFWSSLNLSPGSGKNTLRWGEGSHNTSAKQVNTRANFKKYSAFREFTVVRHLSVYQWGRVLTKHLRCNARASTLLPETMVVSRTVGPVGIRNSISTVCIVQPQSMSGFITGFQGQQLSEGASARTASVEIATIPDLCSIWDSDA